MKYVQLIFSPTGGTGRAAELVTSEWGGAVITVDLADAAADPSKCEIAAEDVVLIAIPSFGGRVPAPAAQRLAGIRGNGARCVLMCVYGNRAYEDTLVEMEDLARECGFTVIAAIAAVAEHSIMHQYAAGRPDEADARQLKEFAKAIRERIDAGETKEAPKLPGNRPYKKAGGSGLVPKATKKCVGRGQCAAQCPVGAIDPGNLKSADPKKCFSCMRCVVNCPHDAREVNGAMVAAAALAMKKVCSVRKECELFL